MKGVVYFCAGTQFLNSKMKTLLGHNVSILIHHAEATAVQAKCLSYWATKILTKLPIPATQAVSQKQCRENYEIVPAY